MKERAEQVFVCGREAGDGVELQQLRADLEGVGDEFWIGERRQLLGRAY